MTESTLQQQIISLLSMLAGANNFIFFAPMNEAVMMVLKMFKVPDKTCYSIIGYLKKMGFLPGVSDLIIGSNGKMYCMELKLPDIPRKKKHVQSKGQILFEANCKKTFIDYAVVRSTEEAMRCLKGWGVVR